MLISFHINVEAEFSTWKNPGHQDISKKKKDISSSDFPSGPVVKNLLASAGDTGLTPGPGRSHMLQGNESHVPQLQSLCSRACEPRLSPHDITTEAHMPRPHALQQEKPLQ